MASTFLAVLLPIAALVGFSGPFLTILLAGPAFQAAAGFVFWGVLIEYIRAANSLYVLASHTALRTRSTIRPGLFGACIVGLAIGPLARWNLINGSGLALAGGMLGATAYLAYELRPHFATRLPTRPLITSLVATSPIVVVMLAARAVVPHPSVFEALLVLCSSSGLMLGSVAFIIRAVRSPSYSLATAPNVRT